MQFSEETLYAHTKRGFEDILQDIINDTPFQALIEKIALWKDGKSLIPRNTLSISDITSIHYIRKAVLLDFLKYYECSKTELIGLVKEISDYFQTSTELGLKAVEEIQTEELGDKNEIIHGILSSVPVIVTKLNKEGKITYSAGKGLESLGHKENDLKNISIHHDYIFPENTENIKNALKGNSVTYLGRAKAVNGEIREFQNYFIPDNNGAIGFSIDVTERIEVEKRFQNFIDVVKDYAIFKLTPDGFISSWNEGAEALKGYEKNEIIGKHFSIFYENDLKEKHFPEYELEQATLHGRFETEGIRLRKDGSRFWANVIITALFDEDKNLVGFTKITRDLTERKLAEERLKRSEERFRSLIEDVKDYAIFLLEPDGTIASWNEGAKRIKGYNEDEIIGKHFSIFYTEEKKKQKYPEYELVQAAKHGKFEDEGLRVRKDGSTFYANVLITALHDTSGKLIGFSKITRDLTERKFLEESLQSMNADLENMVKERTDELLKTIKELQRINNDLDNFIYTASHDLKAPISNIEGLISSLFEELGEISSLNVDLREIKTMIDVSVEKFQVTIKDLTEIAKIQKESLENVELVGLSELIDDVKITISDQISRNNAEIIYHLDDCNEIKFVRKNLKSIIYNLISNSIKYRSPERNPIVKIMCSSDEYFNTIICQDNGLGIKAENIDKIFNMFKRFHDHVEGSGVGLYIVKRIIENAGGRIDVESVEGEGSIFKVILPKGELELHS
ncbi:MAG: PAS domain-containing sensor histidine kinase [Sporocytophaga sp.]|uniref:PAS domain-containing sensor histidine kinase n=1 Tax=Sporocytophaga sp. TaxID=2231183 RepID=UPI001B1DD837|nr:PAS domain-containing sensor histidine kinase [Sporocytophaga sp.]MBO9700992.1 PAS domain-containing sensor histidine kinase [Sporocytophaga sp.]